MMNCKQQAQNFFNKPISAIQFASEHKIVNLGYDKKYFTYAHITFDDNSYTYVTVEIKDKNCVLIFNNRAHKNNDTPIWNFIENEYLNDYPTKK